jgi:hypothetical protein
MRQALLGKLNATRVARCAAGRAAVPHLLAAMSVVVSVVMIPISRADGWHLGGSLEGARAVFDFQADGHGPSEKSAWDVGAGIRATTDRGSLELGVDLRYDRSHGDHDNANFVGILGLAATRYPIGTGALRIGLAVGPAAGFVSGYGPGGGTLIVVGGAGEISGGYQWPATHNYRAAIELAIRGDVLPEYNGRDYLAGGQLLHVQLAVARLVVTTR